MSSVWHRFVCAACTVTAAILVLAGTSMAVDRVQAARADAHVTDADRRFALDYLSYNRRAGSHVFRAANVMPGERGDRLLVIGNDGRRYVRRIALTQDKVTDSGFGQALRLQLYDRTVDRCIYPAPRSGEPEFGDCRHWGPWNARSELVGRRIIPASGKNWRPGERHVIRVRYELKPWSTNSDQGQSASFRFVWRYHG